MFNLLTNETIIGGITDIACDLIKNKVAEKSFSNSFTKHKISTDVRTNVRLDVEHKNLHISLRSRAQKAR